METQHGWTSGRCEEALAGLYFIASTLAFQAGMPLLGAPLLLIGILNILIAAIMAVEKARAGK